MNDFLHMRFFSLLAEPSQEVTNEKMQNAYAQFIVHIETVSNSDDKQIIFRMLPSSRRFIIGGLLGKSNQIKLYLHQATLSLRHNQWHCYKHSVRHEIPALLPPDSYVNNLTFGQ